MPAYGAGWSLGTTLRTQPHSKACVVNAQARYPGQVDPSDGVASSRDAWAYLAGCLDAQQGADDMRWQLYDRLTNGPRSSSAD